MWISIPLASCYLAASWSTSKGEVLLFALPTNPSDHYVTPGSAVQVGCIEVCFVQPSVLSASTAGIPCCVPTLPSRRIPPVVLTTYPRCLKKNNLVANVCITSPWRAY